MNNNKNHVRKISTNKNINNIKVHHSKVTTTKTNVKKTNINKSISNRDNNKVIATKANIEKTNINKSISNKEHNNKVIATKTNVKKTSINKNSTNEISTKKNSYNNINDESKILHQKAHNYNQQNDKDKKKTNKKRIANILCLIFLFICLSIFIYSGIKIISWYRDNKKIEKINEKIDNVTDIKEVDDNENVEIIEPEEEIEEHNQYYEYIKTKLIDVDFSELKKINSDTVGWVQVSGTRINYPFVQTKNNNYYLTHAFDKTYNSSGWVFLDYRNNIKEFDKNTILYAHARLNKTMFGSLKNILKSDWYNDKNNYTIKISTPYYNSLWQVFSVYHIPTTNDYIQVDFKDNNEFKDFVNMLKERSYYKFDTTVGANDKIITLSTCYGEDERMVMHAKLIKYAEK